MRFENWHVLVVDDEYDSAQIIEQLMSLYGAQVDVVGNGQECLDFLQAHHPTLIVVDLAMPRMDGWETLEAIRADAHLAQIPVVAITAYHSVNVAANARQAGFDDYFPKPVDTDRFLRRAAELVG